MDSQPSKPTEKILACTWLSRPDYESLQAAADVEGVTVQEFVAWAIARCFGPARLKPTGAAKGNSNDRS
jgi:hypothetical protein